MAKYAVLIMIHGTMINAVLTMIVDTDECGSRYDPYDSDKVRSDYRP